MNLRVAFVAGVAATLVAGGGLQAGIVSVTSLSQLEAVYQMVPYPNADGNALGDLATQVASPTGWDDLVIGGSGLYRWKAVPDPSPSGYGEGHWQQWDAVKPNLGTYDGPVYSNQRPYPTKWDIGFSATLHLPPETFAFYLHTGPGQTPLTFSVMSLAELVKISAATGSPGFVGFYSDDPAVPLETIQIDIYSSYDPAKNGGFGIGQFGIGKVLVPEPGTWAVLSGLGLAGFAGWRRWRRS